MKNLLARLAVIASAIFIVWFAINHAHAETVVVTADQLKPDSECVHIPPNGWNGQGTVTLQPPSMVIDQDDLDISIDSVDIDM